MSKIELDIIAAAKRKDKKAEKEIFLQMAKPIYIVCQKYAMDDHEAKDFLQEVFIHMYEKIKLYDESKSSFSTWFQRLATNRIIDLKRKNKKFSQLPVFEKAEEEFEEINYLDSISDEQLKTAISQLPEGYRIVVNLFVFEKFSHKEIAQKLDIQESTSRSQFSRSKKLLKKILQESLPENYERILAS